MSWSFQAMGKAPAVAAKLVAEIDRMKGGCPEPEETIKAMAVEAIRVALAGQDPNTVVKVVASGMQSNDKSNALNVTIEPQWGWVE